MYDSQANCILVEGAGTSNGYCTFSGLLRSRIQTLQSPPRPHITCLSVSVYKLPESWITNVEVCKRFLNFMQGIEGGSKKLADTKQYVHSVAQVIKHVSGYDKLDIECARPYFENLSEIAAAKL